MRNIFKYCFLIITTIIQLNIGYGKENVKIKPVASEGLIDASNWDFNNNGVIKLNGEWEFYWQQLIKPSQFYDTIKSFDKEYINVPSNWATNKSVLANTNKGFATYRLKIRLNDDNTYYCLKIHDIFTSYKLWINGKLINEIGKISEREENYKPQFLAKEYPIKLIETENTKNKDKIIEIVIQTANYLHTKAGIAFPIYFGTNEDIIKDTKNTFVLNLFIIGIILIIGLTHLFHYFLRRQDKSNLYFGILCLVMILRSITTVDRVLTFWFPDMSWVLLVKLDNFSAFGTMPFFVLFIYSFFKDVFPKIIMKILVYVGFFIAFIIFTTPVLLFNKYQLYFNLYILIGGLYITFGVLLVASFKKQEGSFLTFVAFFILYSTAINDVLSNMNFIQTPFVTQYGVVCFMILQSFIITRRSAHAMQENKTLTIELNNEKNSLEKKILERTEELHLRNRELIKTRRKEMRHTWTNEGLALISDVLSKKRNDLVDLSNSVITTLLKHINAQMGVLYIINEEKDIPSLDLIVTYGCDKETMNKNHFMLGEGLVGSCFVSGKTIYLNTVPENYIKLGSGLGDSLPTSIIIIPLKYEEEVVGIMEFALFNTLKDYQIAYLEKVAGNITSTITVLKTNIQTLKLNELFDTNQKQIKEKDTEIEKMRKKLDEIKNKK